MRPSEEASIEMNDPEVNIDIHWPDEGTSLMADNAIFGMGQIYSKNQIRGAVVDFEYKRVCQAEVIPDFININDEPNISTTNVYNVSFDFRIPKSAHGDCLLSITVRTEIGTASKILKVRIFNYFILDATNDARPLLLNFETAEFSDGELRATGWYLSMRADHELTLRIGNKHLSPPQLGLPREDVAAAFLGYPSSTNAGFSLVQPFKLEDQESEMVATLTDGSGLSISQSLYITKRGILDVSIRVNVEEASFSDENGIRITGWAISKKRLMKIKIFYGNAELFGVKTQTIRTDVEKAFPTYPDAKWSGFNLIVPHFNRSTLDVTIRVLAVDIYGKANEVIVPLDIN